MATPRPRNAEATRGAILSAARERFAVEGFDKATVRAIAADAGANPSLVIRYFGSKEGVFAAAADFDLRLEDMSAVPTEMIATQLARHFFERWEEDEAFTVLLRAAATHSAASDRLIDILGNQVTTHIAQLTVEPDSAPERASLIASQLLGVAFCRYVLKLPPIANMSRNDLIAWLADTIDRYLTVTD